MKLDANLALANLGQALNRLLYRFGLLAIFVIIAIGLVISILMLNSVIARTDQSNGYQPTTTSITFDESTVQKIENLKAESEKTDRIQASGRLLPF